MKPWWIAAFVAGLSFSAPVLAHDDHDERAQRGGYPDHDRSGWQRRTQHEHRHEHGRREQGRREQIRRHFAARAHAKHHMYHRAQARARAHSHAHGHAHHW
jgi:hypothetical protein